jgi:hypothetical protein
MLPRSPLLLVALGVLAGCGSNPGNGGGAGGSTETVTSSTTQAGSGGSQSTPDYCRACSAAEQTGTLAAPALVELSGLVASERNPGAYYAENDSGNAPSVFALDETGKDLGEYQLIGATNIDWEDIARGPCPAGSCVYVGDIGDNSESRDDYALYRFSEPKTLDAGRHPVTFDKFPFVYPDGSHNAETLLLDPTTGETLVVTKVKSGKSSIYAFPLPLTVDKQVTLIKKGKIQPPDGSNRFTGGDVHPTSRGVLLRTYSRLFFYSKDPNQSVVDALLDSAPCSIPVGDDKQGEAVAWKLDGSGYLTSSEGKFAPIFASTCAD